MCDRRRLVGEDNPAGGSIDHAHTPTDRTLVSEDGNDLLAHHDRTTIAIPADATLPVPCKNRTPLLKPLGLQVKVRDLADHQGLREISLQVRVRSSMQLPDEGPALAGAEVLGQWITLSEIRGRDSGKLLAACRTGKVVAVETARQERVAEAKDFFKVVRVEEGV